MKLLLCGDWHITDIAPANRIDNYGETALRKLLFVENTAKENECSFILQPGDFFDRARPSYSLFANIIEILQQGVSIATLFGQHDMRYRNSENTGLQALSKALRGTILLEPNQELNKSIYIHSASYGKDIPKPKKGKFNILILHKMIVDTKLWEGQEDHTFADKFLEKNKFDLIVSGDNHKAFTNKESSDERYLFNLGSMLRSTMTQVDHRPSIIVFDTDKNTFKEVFIPIAPANDVFQIEKVEKEKTRNAELDLFVKGLSSYQKQSLSFEDDLHRYMNENKINDNIRKIIEEGLQ